MIKKCELCHKIEARICNSCLDSTITRLTLRTETLEALALRAKALEAALKELIFDALYARDVAHIRGRPELKEAIQGNIDAARTALRGPSAKEK